MCLLYLTILIERRNMARKMRPSRRSGCTLFFTLFISACAAPAPQAINPPPTASNTVIQPASGTIVSVRRITFQPGQTAEISSVNAVLTALGEDLVSPPLAGEEIVIEKNDGNPASLAQPNQSTNLAIGDRVLVVQGSPPAIIHRN